MDEREESDHPRDDGKRFVDKANSPPESNLVTPGVLDYDEMIDVQLQFGVDEEQVRRDHAISHALAALSDIDNEYLVFFGGTALSRTILTQVRLSEDIDLIALAPRTDVAAAVQRALEDRLGTTLGRPVFSPDIHASRHPNPSVMQVGGVRVQIQLLDNEGYPAWPTEAVDLEQRYSDAPPARMRTLTPAAFVASKLESWADRRTPRDLYDLWALGERGFIDAEAKALFGKLGPFHGRIGSHLHPAPDRCPMGSGTEPSVRRAGDGGRRSRGSAQHTALMVRYLSQRCSFATRRFELYK